MNSLYIHIPFCEKKCLYCSFVVTIAQQHRIDAYLNCLEKEMQRYQGERLKTIYIGGGTPTLLNCPQLERLMESIRRMFVYDGQTEITIEVNPEGMDLEKAQILSAWGVNRVSLGIQSLNDRYLKFLGRCHDASMALKTFHTIRKAGFKNINVDLMYSFPKQTFAEIADDIQKLVALQSEHMSLYTLTIEPHSRFYAKHLIETENNAQAEHYACVLAALRKAGFDQYEVSNFARPGRESRHNLVYWTGGNYIGLGVGAHSHQDGERRWNVSRLQEYITCLQTDRYAIAGSEKFSAQERLLETFLLGLRMNAGIDIQQMQKQLACVFPEDKMNTIHMLMEAGYLNQENDRMKATDRGRLILDEIAARLI